MSPTTIQSTHNDEAYMDTVTDARQRFIPGDKYSHYKHPGVPLYEIVGVVVIEETLIVGVAYQALYDEKVIWWRPLEVFESTVEWGGQTVPRFQKVE